MAPLPEWDRDVRDRSLVERRVPRHERRRWVVACVLLPVCLRSASDAGRKARPALSRGWIKPRVRGIPWRLSLLQDRCGVRRPAEPEQRVGQGVEEQGSRWYPWRDRAESRRAIGSRPRARAPVLLAALPDAARRARARGCATRAAFSQSPRRGSRGQRLDCAQGRVRITGRALARLPAGRPARCRARVSDSRQIAGPCGIRGVCRPPAPGRSPRPRG